MGILDIGFIKLSPRFPHWEETECSQQRMAKKLSSVVLEPSDKHYRPDIPDSVYNFRETVKRFKSRVFDALEENTEDKHNPVHLKAAISRILQLGSILRVLLNPPTEDGPNLSEATLESVRKLFQENGVEFDQLSEEEKSKCLQYVDIDIFCLTYSARQAHTNSLAGIRK
jgi:hypothetical protein